MHSGSERIGLMLAALSLAINILLSMAHMGMFGERLSMDGVQTPVVAAAPGFGEASLLAALTQLCTDHGLAQRTVKGKGDSKPTLFPTCPLCLFFAATTLVLAFGQLLLVLRRIEIGRLRPLAATRRLSEFLLSLARSRAPPSLRIAA